MSFNQLLLIPTSVNALQGIIIGMTNIFEFLFILIEGSTPSQDEVDSPG